MFSDISQKKVSTECIEVSGQMCLVLLMFDHPQVAALTFFVPVENIPHYRWKKHYNQNYKNKKLSLQKDTGT